MKYKTKTVKLEQIEVDPRAQTRAGELDSDHIDQMVEDLDNLPPMKCVAVGDRLLLADGFHRFAAYRKKRMIRVDILAASGTEDDWIDAFAKANDDQKGKPRTRADKRASVLRVVEMRPNWSARRVAEAAGVSHDFANRLKGSGVINDTSNDTETAIPSEKREGRDGKLHPATKPKPPVYVDPEDVVDDEPETTTDAPEPTPETDAQPIPASEPVNQQEPEPADDPEQVDTTEETTGPTDAVDDYNKEVNQLCRDMDEIARRIESLKEKPLSRFTMWQGAKDQVRSARNTLWQGRPVCDCPYCKEINGEAQPSCKACHGHGVVTKITYESKGGNRR